ncbi:NAD-dependent epimerase/dehydratase family protein [Paenibacillus thermotolerans]|uniref:NAD-dependent epimerase/dehydratase family protein n=1 Tax=Paenibacillus thermotolerans TaxID=3027807 RepID=UPI002367467D|nr:MULTISPECIES: NAD-dependent epimerase/dehydratase family protein [unclassified Paenibacillus]
MKIVVLGGTRFVGKTIVEAALAGGHEVTLFNRGSRADLFPDVERLTGDRDGNLGALKGRTWDAVIDTCGYVPRIVADSVELLKEQTGHYTFISTIDVYDHTVPGTIDEAHPTVTLEDETTEDVQKAYGPMKARCEQIVRRNMPDRSLIVRCGLVAGPGDHTDRLTYWPRRIARGGEVLAPGNPDAPIQFIDARDAAEWIIRMAEKKLSGTFTATGPSEPITVGAFLESCKDVLNSDAKLTWADDEFLLKHQVGSWIEMPLWIPEKENLGALMSIDVSHAKNAGLTYRPLRETLLDIAEWDRSRPDGYEMKAGLAPEKEIALLELWNKERA